MDYNHIAPSYNELHKDEQFNKIRILREHLDITTSDHLLDVGCGTGLSLDFFDCHCIGIEPSVEMASLSRHPIIIGHGEKLPFADHVFDMVISVTALHHMDIERALDEMKRVGKEKFGFSVLKRAKRFEAIKQEISKRFIVTEMIDEPKDVVFVCRC